MLPLTSQLQCLRSLNKQTLQKIETKPKNISLILLNFFTKKITQKVNQYRTAERHIK